MAEVTLPCPSWNFFQHRAEDPGLQTIVLNTIVLNDLREEEHDQRGLYF